MFINKRRSTAALSASVVVNTVNRAAQLEDTIRGLLCLDFEPFEIVVVNGPSTDQTSRVLERYSREIKIVACPEHNLSLSRNIGIANSVGDFVAFIDDDAVPHPTWLTKIESHYRRPEVGGVGGFTVDKTGVRWQARKTICDRYGEAFSVSDQYDERPLNRVGSPFYPSLLGTNSSFRRSVLHAIGGFDHTFAYLLDETDVCLRIVDKGYEIVYEPNAIVFHKGAASDRRSEDWTPKTLLPSARSKSYFIMRHGAGQSQDEAVEKLHQYREEIARANDWLVSNNRITWTHGRALTRELTVGIDDGKNQALRRSQKINGDLDLSGKAIPHFKEVPASDKLRIVLISRTFPPFVDAGIARWTKMIAAGLAARGHTVHVITQSTLSTESVSFEKGIWFHRVIEQTDDTDAMAVALEVPQSLVVWMKRAKQEVELIKSFGQIVVSFPIWDLEGFACLKDPEIGLVMSLHTSYALAKPFKREWNMRPLYEALMVNRVISAEARALLEAPVILANSKAIISDLQRVYDLDFSDKVVLAPHGTDDLLQGLEEKISINQDFPLRVLFVGRHETRKGFDLVIETINILRNKEIEIEIWLVGGVLTNADEARIRDVLDLQSGVRLRAFGLVSRGDLEQLYRTCDVVLMPSRYESFGLVAIEGMSAAKPVIGLSAGGLDEIIEHGVNGFKVEDSAASSIHISEYIAALSSDRKMLANMASAARETFESRFTIDIMIDDVETAYKKAAQKAFG